MKQELPAIRPQGLGKQVPRRGHGLLAGLGNIILRLMGWRIVGELPDVPRAVLVVAPHTSNVDGLIGLSAIQFLRVHVRFMAKHTLFEGRAGKLMHWLGGIPVNRDNSGDLVQQTAAAIASKPCWLGLAPEGTRKGAQRWKTGFYHIAQTLDMPVVMVGLCYRRRQVRIVGTVHPSGDTEKDLALMVELLSDITPRHPDRLSVPFLQIKRHQRL